MESVVKRMDLNFKQVNIQLEALIKCIEKNKIKYPIGITYDQLSKNILEISKEEEDKDLKIVSFK